MLKFESEISTVVQGLIAVIMVGVFYTLYATTKVYGGLIGRAIRSLGVGMIFVAVGVLERVLLNLSVIESSPNLVLAQDFFSMIGLLFLGVGFSRLAAATKV